MNKPRSIQEEVMQLAGEIGRKRGDEILSTFATSASPGSYLAAYCVAGYNGKTLAAGDDWIDLKQRLEELLDKE